MYDTPCGTVPSVTTILSATSDKSGLESWRKRIGDERADKESLFARNLGSLLHEHLENHLLEKPRKQGNNRIHKMAREMANVVIDLGLGNIEEVWGVEEHLYYPQLYAGTSDLIGIHKGEPAICDFKNSKKIKKEKDIIDYFLQGTAYCLAHNELFGTDIKKIVIFMVSREKKFKEFVIQPTQFNRYRDDWINRLEQFYTSN